MENVNNAPSSTIFIRNLPWKVTAEDLTALFSDAGFEVVSSKILWDRETNRSRGCGFVEFQNEEVATEAIEKFNNYEFSGRPIYIDFARKREQA